MANIIFDFDGVLVRSRFPDKSFLWQENIEKDLGLPGKVIAELFRIPDWTETITGQRHFEETIERVFDTHGVPLLPKDFIQYWLSKDLNWYEPILAIAEDLRSNGHKLFVATNQDKIRGHHIRNQVAISKLFESVFTSADLGVCKPNPHFYKRIRDNHFQEASEGFLVIDDDIRNIEAAKSIGWGGICFNPDLEASHTPQWLRSALVDLL